MSTSNREHRRRGRFAGSDVAWVERGSGPGMLLLHGLGHSADAWQGVLPDLSRSHRVVAVDLPGSGSPPPEGAPYLEHCVEMAAALCRRRFPGESVTVVGHSLGGSIAMRLALDHPGLVSRLVLIAPAGVGRALPPLWRLIVLEPLARRLTPLLGLTPAPVRRRLFAEAYRRAVFSDPSSVSPELAERAAGVISDPQGAARLLARAHDILDSLGRRPLAAEANDIDIPVHIIWGGDDRLAPASDGEALAGMLRDVTVDRVDGTGHCPQLERPHEIASLVGRRLRERHGATLPRAAGHSGTMH